MSADRRGTGTDPRAHPREHYQMVAEVYNEAIEARTAPGVAVAATWEVPVSTAHRWAKRARELGLLEPPALRCTGRCLACCTPSDRTYGAPRVDVTT